jgi:hypothetical protein
MADMVARRHKKSFQNDPRKRTSSRKSRLDDDDLENSASAKGLFTTRTPLRV